MAQLEQTGLIPHLHQWHAEAKPLLGICLGLQLLFEGSEEGRRPGLGLLKGHVRRLPGDAGERIPHMGWAPLQVSHPCPLLGHDEQEEWMYFVHSYAAHPADASLVAATTEYGGETITAAVGRDNIFATQFHPEKSQAAGIFLLRGFVATVAGSQAGKAEEA